MFKFQSRIERDAWLRLVTKMSMGDADQYILAMRDRNVDLAAFDERWERLRIDAAERGAKMLYDLEKTETP